MPFSYKFSAVKGLQAGRDYYIAMIPLGILPKLFSSEEEYLLPEFRSQRRINELRIHEIRDYILANPSNYVFSALSASIDGDFTFVKSELDENIGVLEIDMNAVIIINDGQHRKAAIEAALKESPELAKETISVVLFKDEGLKRSQQMFADLNKHAVKSTMSLSTLYDNRDDFANAVKQVMVTNKFLSKYIDKEKDSLGKNSSKLFTLANFLRANKRIVKDSVITDQDQKFLLEYWDGIIKNITEWQELENKQLHKCSLREDYILTLSVTLNAFGRLGRYFYENQLNMESLAKLNEIDWTRNNPAWINRVLTEQGRIIYKEDAIIKICNYIKKILELPLSKEELLKEKEVERQ